MFKTGYRPDVKDSRDISFNKLLAASPKKITPLKASLEAYVVDVLDQGNLGSCVSQAGFQAVRISQVKQLKDSKTFTKNPPIGSRLFGYYNSRSYHNETTVDSGTYIRYFFKALNKFGFCPEKVMPYDTSKFAKRPTFLAYKKAFDQKDPTDYYRIDETGDSRLEKIRLAVANGYPVVFGTSVSNDFCSGIGINGTIAPPINKSIAGGHAMCVVGYESNYFVILNSWGDSFGNNGRILFSGDYMKWDQTSDLWVVKSAPEYSE